MRTKKLLLLVLSFGMCILCLISCNKSDENIKYNDDVYYSPNIVVSEVGDYVKYNVLANVLSYERFATEQDGYYVGECILWFGEYKDFKNSMNNDQYTIYDGNKIIKPSDLKVGDMLYFDFSNIIINSPKTSNNNQFEGTTGVTQVVYDSKSGKMVKVDDEHPFITFTNVGLIGNNLYLCKK